VAKDKKKYHFIAGFLIIIIYFFIAARPIPEELVLAPRWLSSVESNYPIDLEGGSAVESGDSPEIPAGEELFPFILGDNFGYIGEDGRFALNRKIRENVSVSEKFWAEYGAVPNRIEIMDPRGEVLAGISEPRGYPFFIDNRFFLIHEDQTSLTALDDEGKPLWTYDFAAPITDIDAAAGLVLAGSLDGTVELLDSQGKRVFFFEPGGSRLSVICGCRISRDGSKLAVISGIDDQRFLLLEKLGDTYRVVYHEFLSDGFRRQIQISFINGDQWIVFEIEGGLLLYNIGARNSIKLSLEGSVTALESSGMDNLLFAVTAQSGRKKRLVGIRLPHDIIMQVPFSSENIFLRRQNRRLYVGGGSTIASFDLIKQ
jgi:hypothetical protein